MEAFYELDLIQDILGWKETEDQMGEVSGEAPEAVHCFETQSALQ